MAISVAYYIPKFIHVVLEKMSHINFLRLVSGEGNIQLNIAVPFIFFEFL